MEMEKKLKKLMKILITKYKYTQVSCIYSFSYAHNKIWIDLVFNLGTATFRTHDINSLIDILIKSEYIKKEDLLSAKREKEETIINKGKL